jgi:outer membrane protein assembly factor BamB
VIWKHYLGKGVTVISRKIGSVEWAGAGWTGQPLMIREGSDTFLIQGAYDHHLKKLRADDGSLVWQYRFDDVVKGTGTLWVNHQAREHENSIIILQGSRLGVGNYLDSEFIPSFRAISYFTGEELWRKDVAWTDSYSRDADGSALVVNDTGYIGLENSLFTVFTPDPAQAQMKDSMLQPRIYLQKKLYLPDDVISHSYNVVTESSPCKIGRMIYVASGSGHVWGYDMDRQELTWDFYTGADMDGSTVVTADSCLLVSVEKQYIRGQGGVFKLDPSKDPDKAVVWFCPVPDTLVSGWEGGVIGSSAVSDSYNDSRLAAFIGIDGQLRVVKHNQVTDQFHPGPDSLTLFPVPMNIFQFRTGPSISTPLFTADKLVVCGYEGVFLFEYNANLEFTLKDKFRTTIESTPFVADGRLYIASRDGYMYCLGAKD